MLTVAVKPHWHTPWPSSAQTHLLKTIFGDLAGARAEYGAWRQATDLRGEIDYATYRLLPMLEARLRAIGIKDDFTGRCKGVYRRSWFENNLMFAHVATLVARLEQAGIATMLLKGAPLAMLFYPEHAARPMSDVDLVVRPRDIDAAIDVIAGLPDWRRLNQATPDLERLYKHSMTFVGERMQLDLHWHCLWETRGVAANAWFWHNAVPFDFKGVATSRPSDTALLFSVIVHGLRCNPASPIRWVADAVQILRREHTVIDWDGLVAFARTQRLTSRLGSGLSYLRQSFAPEIPEDVPARLLGTRPGIVERAENSLYLAEPAAYDDSLRQRLSRMLANFLTVTDARSARELAVRLLADPSRFFRIRRDIRRYHAAQRADRRAEGTAALG